MVQEFHVVQCFSCQSFQVQQVKKVNRWRCKLCGEKQSLLKEFGRGSAADCRRHVQKLNTTRGVAMEEQDRHTWLLCRSQVKADAEDDCDDHVTTHTQVTHTQVSCWSKYLNTPEEAEPEEEDNVLMDREQVNGNMIDRKRRWTERRGPDIWSPEQSNWTSPNRTRAPGLRGTGPNRTSAPGLRGTGPNRTSAPGLRGTGPNRTSAPGLRGTGPDRTSAPCLSSSPSKQGAGSVSRWAQFLSPDCQVMEGEEPFLCRQSHSVGGAALLSCNDIIKRPSLPVSSMFESGDDFDEFLTAENL